jgi:restriction endonuclease S subunit
LQEGDIVFSRSGNTVGKTYLLEKNFPKAIYASYLIRIRIKELTTAKFLYYYFHSDEYWKKIKEGISGIGQPNFNGKKLSNLEVPYPPLPEQHRIVAKIEELFSELENGVANLEKTKEQLQTYRQAVLKHAFEGRLTENWRAHNPAQSRHAFTEETGQKEAEPKAVYQQMAQATANNGISQETLENLPGPELLQYIKAERQRQYEQALKEWEQKAKAAKAKAQKKPAKPKKPKEMDPLTEEELQQLPELPEGWCWVKLGDISYLITKGASPKWQGFNYTQDNSQTLFITSENVRENFLDISNPKFLENSFNDKQKNSVLRKYDLLINIVGASIGRASVFKLNSLANINQAVSKVSLVNHEMAEFYSLYFNSKIANDIFNLKKVDVARANLSLHDINNIPVPLSSIKEQKQIVREIESRLSVADNLSESIDQSLQQAQSMRQSILKKAFEGKLVENEEEVEAETS